MAEYLSDNHPLVEVIDFFAQNLSFEQIITYGYPYVHDVLHLDQSGIYVLEDDQFKLKDSIECEFTIDYFSHKQEFSSIATKFGRILVKELEDYFDADFLESNKICFAIPIISKDKLLAIIFSCNDHVKFEDRGVSDYYFAVNQLMNKAAESALSFDRFNLARQRLDRKVYNLMFINHSTRALMAEKNIEKLYQLGVETVSELSASGITSFGIYDKFRNRIILRGYSDLLNYEDIYFELEVKDHSLNKTIYHIERDYSLLETIFDKAEYFKQIQAEYVILIREEGVVGFVTIAKPVTGKMHSESMLEQIEALTSSIYIAIKNAQYIRTIAHQKESIKVQYDGIVELNNVIKNINSCESISELSEITMKTLHYSFNMKKAMIVINYEEQMLVESTLGFDLPSSEIHIPEKLKEDTYFEAKEDSYQSYLPGLISHIGPNNCLVSTPISVNNMILGYLIIFEIEGLLQPSQVALIENIASSIGPLIHQMHEKDIIQKLYKADQEALFMKKLAEALENRETYYIDFQVYVKWIEKKIFNQVILDDYKNMEVFYFDNYLFYISDKDDFDLRLFDFKLDVEDVESFKNEILSI